MAGREGGYGFNCLKIVAMKMSPVEMKVFEQHKAI